MRTTTNSLQWQRYEIRLFKTTPWNLPAKLLKNLCACEWTSTELFWSYSSGEIEWTTQISLKCWKCSHVSMSSYMHHFCFSATMIENLHVQKDLGGYKTNDLKHPHKKGVLFMLKRSSPRLTPSVEFSLYKYMVMPVLLH